MNDAGAPETEITPTDLGWQPNDQGLAYLVERGRVEKVPPNAQHASHLLQEARRHLLSAATLSVTDDVSMAFVAAYDAARKSLSAILAVQGYRSRGGDGGHMVLLDAVRSQFPQQRVVLQRFDWMRTVRNSCEYPDVNTPAVSTHDVADAEESATAILELAVRFVSQYPHEED